MKILSIWINDDMERNEVVTLGSHSQAETLKIRTGKTLKEAW
jgi:hypothetical protein